MENAKPATTVAQPDTNSTSSIGAQRAPKSPASTFSQPAPNSPTPSFPQLAPKTSFQDTSSLSDEQLLKLCQRYGEQSRIWRQKFAGLLPEVNRRRLYEKRGFSSIFEFALKLAGMSENQVCRVLNLERKFEDKPALYKMLINGEVSPNKLIKIAPIATTQNQEDLAVQVKMLPCRALETLARDEKMIDGQLARIQNDAGPINNFEYQNGLNQPKNGLKFDHVSIAVQSNNQNVNAGANYPGEANYPGGANYPGEANYPGGTNCPVEADNAINPFNAGAPYINNDIELVASLKNEVKVKLIELKRKGIDINNMIMEMLEVRSQQIEEEKQRIVECDENSEKNRYIPAQVKRIIKFEHGQKCSISHCDKPAENIHHTQRFALNSTHDPRYLAPLCAQHHKIAHTADQNWQHHRS